MVFLLSRKYAYVFWAKPVLLMLQEDGFNLLSIMKGTITYRRSRRHDFVTDYLPPSISDFRKQFDQDNRQVFHFIGWF